MRKPTLHQATSILNDRFARRVDLGDRIFGAVAILQGKAVVYACVINDRTQAGNIAIRARGAQSSPVAILESKINPMVVVNTTGVNIDAGAQGSTVSRSTFNG